ncbi:uncharacterized protein RCC_08754 [Ramularia collo-cygni]|uniref:Lsm14-like N-terminal domain-containing protein n=1 Tax=Ramularia collo-cygni TaxID=112498 RepID=A0A2D3VKT8_9PEZI|nr:uncharacterized protein RCC_08754 [Ramularia collo-cygni]CZT23044.1 uncharacterized protein RCC_08754 [Ramularia collo-cygni]
MPLQDEYCGQAVKIEMPPLGTRISIILDSNIRYEGTLESIDSEGGNFIILRRVDLHGTEDRPSKRYNHESAYANYADSVRFTVHRIKKVEIVEENFEHSENHVSTSAQPAHLPVATSSSILSMASSIEQLTASSSPPKQHESMELLSKQEELKARERQVAKLERIIHDKEVTISHQKRDLIERVAAISQREKRLDHLSRELESTLGQSEELEEQVEEEDAEEWDMCN